MLSPRLQSALKATEDRSDRIRAFNELMGKVAEIDFARATPKEVARLTNLGVQAVWQNLKASGSPAICTETIPSLPEELKEKIADAAKQVRTETDRLNARYEISEIAFFSGFIRNTAEAGPT